MILCKLETEGFKSHLGFLFVEGRWDVVVVKVSPHEPRRWSLIHDLRTEMDRLNHVLNVWP